MANPFGKLDLGMFRNTAYAFDLMCQTTGIWDWRNSSHGFGGVRLCASTSKIVTSRGFVGGGGGGGRGDQKLSAEAFCIS